MTASDDSLLESLEKELDAAPHNVEQAQILKEAKQASEMLASGEIVIIEDIRDLISMLDEKWPYLNRMMKISGRIYYAEMGEDCIRDKDVLLHEERSMFSDEVYSVGFDTRKEGDEDVLGLVFVFSMSEDQDIILPVGDEKQYLGWAKLNDVVVESTIVECDDAEEYLKYYLPDIHTQIREIEENSETDIDFFEQLRDFEIDSKWLTSDSEQKDLSAINNFLTEQAAFEGFVPYSGAIRGILYLKDEDDKLTYFLYDDWKHILLVPVRCIMTPVMRLHRDGEVELNNSRYMVALEAHIHFVGCDGEEGKVHKAVLPVTEDFHIVSNNSTLQKVDTTQFED